MYGWYYNLTLATYMLMMSSFQYIFLDILRPNRKYNLPFGRLDPHVVEGRRELLQYYLGVRIVLQNIHACFSIYYIGEFVTTVQKVKLVSLLVVLSPVHVCSRRFSLLSVQYNILYVTCLLLLSLESNMQSTIAR